jgi:hypothetical protein
MLRLAFLLRPLPALQHMEIKMHSGRTMLFALTAAFLPAAAAHADMTAMQRAAAFGISDIRGVAYIPGPQGPAKPIDPSFYPNISALPYFLGGLQTYTPKGDPFTPQDPCTIPGTSSLGLCQTWTIWNDSDFYNADFASLWSAGTDRGRDDLGRFKAELNANYIRPYDWQANPQIRNHHPFLDYANSLGMNVSIPISNYTYKVICGSIPKDKDWQQKVKWVFDDMYKSGSIDRAAGMLEIFNEFDASECQNATYVAKIAQYWKSLEDGKNIPDTQRLPISFPVTFAITNGLPGGAVLDAFNAIKNMPGLGLNFWKSRVIYAVNTFNSGPFMKNWLTNTLPAWFTQNGIPADTPVVFTEYGRSSGNEDDQADWVKAQFQALWPNKPKNFLGACAFVNEYRFWLQAPEPNFTLMNFNQGSGSWGKPKAMYVHTEQYQNPNADIGTLWTAQYQIDPQKPRKAYCEIGKVYFGSKTPPACP